MSVLDGFIKTKKHRKLSDGYQLESQWTSSQTVELDNGSSLENPAFTEASTRENITSKESLPTILGKITKWFADLKPVAFSGSYDDLSNKPTIPSATSIANNLTTTTSGYALDARQGKTLNDNKVDKNSTASLAAIELSAATPFIDFHYNKSASDNTSRIIESAEGSLNINNVKCQNGSVSATNLTASSAVSGATVSSSGTLSAKGAITGGSSATLTGNLSCPQVLSNYWRSSTYGGGWYMTDTSWIRNYGSKGVYIDQNLRVDNGLQVGASANSIKCIIRGTFSATPSGSSLLIANPSTVYGWTGNKISSMDTARIQTAMFASNGHGDVNVAHITGCTCQSGGWFVTFDRGVTTSIRLNYMFIAWW